jgi:hypothetical protein
MRAPRPTISDVKPARCHLGRQTDRHTDRHTDRQADTQTDSKAAAAGGLNSDGRQLSMCIR